MKMSLRVTDLRFGDTRHSLKHQFDAPKTASPKLGELLARRRNIVVGTLRNRRRLRGGLGGSGAESELGPEIHGGPFGRNGSEGFGEGGNGFDCEIGLGEEGFGEIGRGFWEGKGDEKLQRRKG